MASAISGLAAVSDTLASLCPNRGLAVDCGSGVGDAAIQLSGEFVEVAAIDLKAAHLHRTPRAPGVFPICARAEDLPLADQSVDLLFTLQSLHHFDIPAFIKEATRILRPGGIFAALCYGRHKVNSQIDRACEAFYAAVEPHWEPEYSLVMSGYAELDLPFQERALPELFMERRMNRQQFGNYLRSWTASRRFHRRNGYLPVPRPRASLFGGPAGRIPVRWPILGRVGQRM